MNIETLNQEFSIDEYLSFSELNKETVTIDITNSQCRGNIVLQGAHLIRWQPVHCDDPVIWLSDDACFARGKSVRGGIPICWPWFGQHESAETFPAHGYARTVDWELISTKQVTDSETELQFRLIENEHSRSLWPHESECSLAIIAGKTLKLSLTTENVDDRPFILGEALHTYFHVADIEQVKISGLENCDYYDKVRDVRQRQQDVIRFKGETDRVYMNTRATCVIEDEKLGRRITIEKSGSDSTVVWNPWLEKARQMGDMGNDGWRHMLCVESANAMDNRLTIQPGESHTLSVECSVDSKVEGSSE